MKMEHRERVTGTDITIGRRVYYRGGKKVIGKNYSAEFGITTANSSVRRSRRAACLRRDAKRSRFTAGFSGTKHVPSRRPSRSRR